jgi:hypothetical protein
VTLPKLGSSRLSRRVKGALAAQASASSDKPLEVELNPKQYRFHAHCGNYVRIGEREGYEFSYTLYGGAAGGGKTHAICESALLTASEEPGSVIAIMRNTRVNLEASTLRGVFLQFVCPEGSDKWNRLGIDWNKQDNIMTLHGTADPSRDLPPSQIWWLGAQSGDGQRDKSWEKFLSTQFSRIYCDEGGQLQESTVEILPSRCRLHRPGVVIRNEPVFKRDPLGNLVTDGNGDPVVDRVEPRRGYRLGIKFASNPSPNWLKTWFLDEKRYNHLFIPAGIGDNLHNLPIDYRRQFDSMPDYLRRRMLDGDWTAFEGQVWPGGVTPIHRLEGLELSSLSPKWWSAIMAVDPGLNDPTAAVWAVYRFDDDYQAIVFLADYLQREATVESHAANFRLIETRLGLDRWPSITRLIDPDANKRTLSGGPTQNVRSMFADQDFHFVNAPNGTEAKTLSMARALRIDPDRRHPVTDEPGAPLVFWRFPDCKASAANLNALEWDNSASRDGTQQWANRNKHLPDVQSYVTAWLRLREKKTERRPMPERYRIRYEEYA